MKAYPKARVMIVSMLVLISMLAAALPQTASAAATCRTYYTVKEDDTTVYIAQTFGLKWKEIARANDLDSPKDLEEGLWLCIPPAGLYLDNSDLPVGQRNKRSPDRDRINDKDDDDATNPNARVVFTVTGDRIFVDASRFDEDSKLLVKVRDPGTIAGGWYKVGLLRVRENKAVRGVYDLPEELDNLLYVNICLKDQTTDETYCDIVVNY